MFDSHIVFDIMGIWLVSFAASLWTSKLHWIRNRFILFVSTELSI